MYIMLTKVKVGEITGEILIWAEQDPDYPNHGSEKHQWGYIGMPVEILEVTDYHYFISDFNKVYEPIYALKELINIIDIKWKQLEVNTCK